MADDDLQSRLEQGLHQESLRDLRDLGMRLAEKHETPLGYYVLASVLGDLESRWESRPVPAKQVSAAEDKLIPVIRRVIFDLQRDAPEGELLASLNRLVMSFIDLQRSGAIG
jgi:hypothetical protein